MGKNVEVSLYRDLTFAQHFAYALDRGARSIVICGENEHAKNPVQIKDTHTREQKAITQHDIATYFASEVVT